MVFEDEDLLIYGGIPIDTRAAARLDYIIKRKLTNNKKMGSTFRENTYNRIQRR